MPCCRALRPAMFLALLLLAFASPAAADSYLSLGIGPQATIGGALERPRANDPARSGRVMMGQRLGPLAMEAGFFGTGLPDPVMGVDSALVSAAAEVKYHVSLLPTLELYGKGGLNYGWVGVAGQGTVDRGNGYTVGAGLQLRISPAPLGSAALWLDYTVQQIELTSGARGTLGMANLGLSVGI